MSKLQSRADRAKYFCQLTGPEVVERLQRYDSGSDDNQFMRTAPRSVKNPGINKAKPKSQMILKPVPEHLF